MSRGDDASLIDIATRVADGGELDWAFLLTSHPEAAASLRHLQRIHALAELCRAGSADEVDVGDAADGSTENATLPRSPSTVGLPVWGPLVLLEKVGEGSFGEVYRARDRVLQRDVALKLRRRMGEGELTAHQRHLEEARLLARVQHPNVLAVHGVEVHEGRPGIWTDFIEGETLEDRVAAVARGVSPPLSCEEILRVGRALARALTAIHRAGLIHGDIKTTNVMRRPDGDLVLTDFGAGRVFDPAAGARARDGVAGAEGTPLSMAPELFRGAAASPASDLYAMGALLYRMASCRHPIEAANLVELIERVQSSPPIPLAELRPDLPRALAGLIERLLQRDPGERPESAADVELDLSLLAGGPSFGECVEPTSAELPSLRTPLIGRRAELLATLQALRAARLVSLLGPGGVGKTRLAKEAAHRIGPRFAGGVGWVDLATLEVESNLETLAQEMARALRVPIASAESALEALRRAAGGVPRIWILDNAEHLLPLVREMAADLLGAARELHLLVTSREPLGVDGESRLLLEPMNCPRGEESKAWSAVEALEYDAIRFLVDRAHRHVPEFVLTNELAPALVSIARDLDGLPLALELAAARLRGLGPHELARRIRTDLDRELRQPDSPSDARHRTLRACLASSYEALDEPSQRFFEQLSVFRVGWTLEAAEAIVDPDAALRLQKLIERSLVIFEAADPNSPSALDRYRLLEPVRAFAAACAPTQDPMRLGRLQHLRYYRQLAEAAEAHFQGPEQRLWMARVEADNANFEQALDLVTEEPDVTEEVMRLATSLARYWMRRGWLAHGLLRFTSILNRPGSEAPSKYRAALCNWLGNFRAANGEGEAAAAAHRENLELSRALGERRSVAVALDNLANDEFSLGRWECCLTHSEESFVIMEELSDRRGMAYCLVTMSRAEQALGEHEHAIGHLERSLGLQRALGDALGAALVLHNLGVSLIGLQRFAEAESIVLQALALRRQESYTVGIASTLRLLATTSIALEKLDEAEAALRECLGLFAELQHRVGLLQTLDNCATIAVRRGSFQKGAAILGLITGQRERASLPAPPENVAHFRALEEMLRAQLGDAAFELEFEVGKLWNLERVIPTLV